MSTVYPSTLYERPAQRPEGFTEEERHVYTMTVRPELFRVVTYCLFWGMCIFAFVVRAVFVIPIIEAGFVGNHPEQKGCGPFNRGIDRANKVFDLDFGDGFTIQESHLVESFGYNNICVAWDYTPSRESTAMVFPFFEYSLVMYLILDYVAMMLSYRRGEIGGRFWVWVKIATPINILFSAWFRLIFVYKAYETTRGHTSGFLCLQVALLFVALNDVIYILMTNQSYPSLGLSKRGTKIIAWLYIIPNVLISVVKLYATFYIVMDSEGGGLSPDFYKIPTPIFGMVLGQIIDYVWMFFNALCPWVMSVVRMRDERPFTIKFEVPHNDYEDEYPPLREVGLFRVAQYEAEDTDDTIEASPLNGEGADGNESPLNGEDADGNESPLNGEDADGNETI